MKELVKITENNGKRVVSARELHKQLNVKTLFKDWIKRRIKQYDLIEGTDFILLKNEPLEYQTLTVNQKKFVKGRFDYALTIDCAKELAMVENNAQGKKIRRYFIEVEKEFNRLLSLPPIGEVYPIIQNLLAGYPRREIFIESGYSPDSGMISVLKACFPDDFFNIGRTACVSPEFAKLRYEQGKVRQLEIKFREKRKALKK